MSDSPAGEDWWMASDGKWYPPELHPVRLEAERATLPPLGPNSRFIPLRYGGTCLACGRHIEKGERGWHDPDIKKVVCSTCRPEGTAPEKVADAAVRNPVGGSSALDVSGKRHDQNYFKGAVGEYILSVFLHRRLAEGAVILDDRRVPGSTANIDHVVVAPSGVWVIDAKKWKGTITYKKHDLGGEDWRLTVGDHYRTSAVEKLYRQVIPVAQVLGDPSVPLRPALVFIDGDWGSRVTLRVLANRPYTHLGVMITWPKALAKVINDPGPLAADRVTEIGQLLDKALPPR